MTLLLFLKARLVASSGRAPRITGVSLLGARITQASGTGARIVQATSMGSRVAQVTGGSRGGSFDLDAFDPGAFDAAEASGQPAARITQAASGRPVIVQAG